MAPWTCTKCTYHNPSAQTSACEMCATTRAMECAKCRAPIRNGGFVVALEKTYHSDCFGCAACHKPFPSHQFKIKDGEPYHDECYKTLFLPVCEVCEQHVPMDDHGRVVYRSVPFWDMRYCPAHENCARCSSCQRIEPLNPRRHFETLSDGRKTCHDCCVTVVLDTNEVQPLVKEVWQFMESIGMTIPYVPVYLVDYSTLNEHRHSSHGGSGGAPGVTNTSFITRGLCLSEVTHFQHIVRRGFMHVRKDVHVEKKRSVNAILILHGLPYDLTAQVLAHEATHAYMKFNAGFPDQINPTVEEGTCQLISYLYLKYKQMMSSGDSSDTFQARLREYYLHQIQHDMSPVYGDGFRRALDAYERTHSLQRIFDHIRDFGHLP